jgi:putative FmdB family regulatory protein
MPIYDYRCTSCDHRFEQLVRGDRSVSCPRCSSGALERLLSLPARRVSGTGTGPDYSRLGPPPGGGCCGGGSCQSHSH